MTYVTQGTIPSTLKVADASTYLANGYWEITEEQYNAINAKTLDPATTKPSETPEEPTPTPTDTTKYYLPNGDEVDPAAHVVGYPNDQAALEAWMTSNNITTTPPSETPEEPTSPQFPEAETKGGQFAVYYNPTTGETKTTLRKNEGRDFMVGFQRVKELGSSDSGGDMQAKEREFKAYLDSLQPGTPEYEQWKGQIVTEEPTTPEQATLYGPNDQTEVVDVGSDRASELQSQGWGLTPGSFTGTTPPTEEPTTPEPNQATLTSPDGKYKTVVNVGSIEASQLLVNGWTVGDTGKNTIDLTTAIGYVPEETKNQATLTSPDGKYKTVVNVGSIEASQLLVNGWTVGDTGQEEMDLSGALGYKPHEAPIENEGDKIIYKKPNPTTGEDDLFYKIGDKYYWIPDHKKLLELLDAGYIDERVLVPEGAELVGLPTQPDIPMENQYDRAFFMDHDKGAFIKFTEDPDGSGPLNTNTLWHVDPNTMTIRPFMSEDAYYAVFDTPLEELEANGQIANVPITFLNEGSPLSGFNMLDLKYAYQNDGSFIDPPVTIDKEALVNHYGSPLDKTAQWDVFRENVSGYLNWLRQHADESGISSTVIDEVVDDPYTLALYTNALTYGGYNQNDIYRDLKRLQMIKDGNTEYNSMRVISESMNAKEYYNTTAGLDARNNPQLQPPERIGELTTASMENKVMNLPSEVLDAFVPTIDWESPMGREKIEEIQAAYHDILLQQVEASNEREQAIADANYKRFNEELTRKYGIALSDNALEAWDQISALGQIMGQKRLGGSGIEREALDKYLQRVRREGEQLRERKLTEEEKTKRDYLMKYGTPEQINALSEEEKIAMGFKPSTKVDKDRWVATFMEKYPDESEEYAKLYYDMLYDEYGNYRSELNKTLLKNKFLIQEGVRWGDVEIGKKDKQEMEAKLAEEKRVEKEEEDTKRKYRGVMSEVGQEAGDIGLATSQVNIPSEKAPNIPSTTSSILPSKSEEEQMAAFREFTAGKEDVLGHGWEGYKPIPFYEYDTPEKKSKWQNVQQVGNTLYGYR